MAELIELTEEKINQVAPMPWKDAIRRSVNEVPAVVGFVMLSGELVRSVSADVPVVPLLACQIAAILAFRRWATGRWFR